MRTAILFTGQSRTLPQVAALLRANLLDPNSVTLFFACEGNPEEILSYFAGYDIGGVDIRPSFKTAEFDAILSMIPGRPAVTDEVFVRSRAVDGMPWHIGYVLHDSGTVIQYYQLWKAYCLLLQYERAHRMRFDACVRTRLDILLTEPIHLDRFVLAQHTSEEEARSMGSDRIRSHVRRPQAGVYEDVWGTPPTDRIVWTFAVEQWWMCRRDIFDVFGPMVFSFGLYDSKKPFAFNSETFFHQHCKEHSIVHYGFLEEGNPVFNTTADMQWVSTILR